MACAVGEFEWHEEQTCELANRPSSTSRGAVGCGQVWAPKAGFGAPEPEPEPEPAAPEWVGAVAGGAPPPPLPPPPPQPAATAPSPATTTPAPTLLMTTSPTSSPMDLQGN